MNTIEQAAKRIEELRRAGIEVPWSATGIEPPAGQPAGPPAAGQPVAGAPHLPAAQAQAVPAQAVAQVAPEAAAQAANADVAARIAARRAAMLGEDGMPRRSREIDLDLERLRAHGYLVPGAERNQMEEEFRIIKRPLLKNAAGESAAPVERGNLIMVTSALPGEGKTFSSINLALSIAMELDHTVLLVDADVVRPSVLDRLGLPPARGLLDVLTDSQTDLSEVLLKTNIPKLTLLPAGTANSRTTELLASGAMEDLLTELATLYQDRIIVFDAPPLLPSTESRVLATKMGQVIVVVEADKTNRATVAQAFATLESCPVVMAVLNKCRGKIANSAYGYYAV